MTEDRAMNRCEELGRILASEALTPLFQPICITDKAEICGYEALIRGPSDSPLHSPTALFETALECQLLSQLELLCRRVAIARFVELKLPGMLFLNVSPMIFVLDDHPHGMTLSYLDEYRLDPERVVIELSEQYPVDEPLVLQKALRHYKDLGLKIAIDDLGAGYSGLRFWSEIKPDFVKIDRYFISKIHQDPIKREFVRSIVALAASVRSEVIAEGIEVEEELDELQELGVHFAQGYLLCRPEHFPPELPPALLKQRHRSRRMPRLMDKNVGLLLQQSAHIDHLQQAGEVADYFHRHPHQLSLPVLDAGVPVGIVWRDDLLEKFSTPYGRALYQTKPVRKLMGTNVVVVDVSTPLDKTADSITHEHRDKLPWHFIITQQGEYLGIGSVRDLLKEITQQQIQYASYANPLTQLPGNVPIYKHIDELLRFRQPFWLAYFDLNHFKPFNDVYGYAQGDKAIKLVADLLSQYCDTQDFIGHVGGDDFVVIFHDHHWQDICQQIVDEFDQRIRRLYLPEDLARGGIEARARTGENMFFPLIGLAVGVVAPDVELCDSHHQVAELASAAKKHAKLNLHSSVFFSRRRG